MCISAPPRIPEPVDPCNPSPCGSNAVCNTRGGAAACQCIPDYFGDPYVACRPECTTNAECPSRLACINLHCKDPCPQANCGINAQCQVVNHIPNCVCLRGYIGDPFTACRLPVQCKCQTQIERFLMFLLLHLSRCHLKIMHV